MTAAKEQISARLFANKAGFYEGRYIKAGDEFDFVGPKLPKWATRADDPALLTGKGKAKPLQGDTKPAAAQAAAKSKASGPQT